MWLLALAIHVNLRAFARSDFPDETICNWKYGSENSDTYAKRGQNLNAGHSNIIIYIYWY